MDALKKLIELYEKTYHESVDEISPLKGDGSERKIYRMKNSRRSVIGIIGNNMPENRAFLSFSRHFFQSGLRVPEIYAADLDNHVYLEEDLGDFTLFEWMGLIQEREGFSDQIVRMYEKSLAQLPHFQIRAGKGIDYSVCYQHREFGWASMVWDVQYFKHRFLEVFYKKPVDMLLLEREFTGLIEYLITEEKDYFLYRDFQSRNIMIKNDEPYFIDYQSGRKGALQYDVASLLYDAKANIAEEIREHLLDFYIQELQKFKSVNVEQFKAYFYGFVYLRIMQACGAYGYLGITKQKRHFLKSVPYAMKNFEILAEKDTIIRNFPILDGIFRDLAHDESLRNF